MTAKESVPTRVLSVYLAKDAYAAPDDLLKKGSRLTGLDISLSASVSGRLYVQPGIPRPPKWASLFTNAVDEGVFGRVSSSAGLLVVPTEDRLLALAFGTGRHLLAPESWEERFGLRVALNSIDENKLRSIDKRTFDAIARHSREQASREASARDFGIDVEQDLLRGVTGIPKNQALGKRMSGMDGLTVAVATTLEDLPDLLGRYVRKSQDTSYRKTFPWVDQLGEVGDPSLVDQLDDALVAKVSRGDLTGVAMAVPDILAWEGVGGFRFGLRASNPEHHDLDLRTFIDEMGGPGKISRATLGRTVHCRDTDGNALHEWPVRRCLHAELEVGKDSFVLSAGKWYRVTRDFVQEINDAYARIPSSRITLPDYREASEGAYNKKVCAGNRQFALMDQKEVSYGGGHSSIEFCDLFTRAKDIIHVKRYGSSAVLSHLFSQGLVSGELFQTDSGFRRAVNGKLPRSHKLDDVERRPRNQEFHVVFAVISDSAGDLKLPFFSRLNIKHAARRLEGYGYGVSKLKIAVADLRQKLKRYR